VARLLVTVGKQAFKHVAGWQQQQPCSRNHPSTAASKPTAATKA